MSYVLENVPSSHIHFAYLKIRAENLGGLEQCESKVPCSSKQQQLDIKPATLQYTSQRSNH